MDHDQEEPPIEATLVQPPAKFLDNKWAVLAILFAVTGFLGLPLLWTNKQFTPAERIFWAIVVTIYTMLLIGGMVAAVAWAINVINEARR